MSYIDAHLHLADPAFSDGISAVLSAARAAGVSWFVVNATGPDDWERVAILAREHPGVIPCFGAHPWFVAGLPPDWTQQLWRRLREQPSAVGEVGIDCWIEPRDEATQERVFMTQLDMARELERPVMVHCLRAWGWLMDLLSERSPLPAGMLIHAYGGPVELIKPLVRHNAYFSFAGNIFETKRHTARAAAAAVPLDRLLLETDAPDMLPPPDYRLLVHRRNEKEHNHPANLPKILEGVARLRGHSTEALADAVMANARRLLGDLLK